MTSLVTGGLLTAYLVTAGLAPGSVGVAVFDYADPRQGTILGVDADPAGVDPRQGTILGALTDPAGVDPRQGQVIK
jgi:hypothetical protein